MFWYFYDMIFDMILWYLSSVVEDVTQLKYFDSAIDCYPQFSARSHPLNTISGVLSTVCLIPCERSISGRHKRTHLLVWCAIVPITKTTFPSSSLSSCYIIVSVDYQMYTIPFSCQKADPSEVHPFSSEQLEDKPFSKKSTLNQHLFHTSVA